jgi:hypothetical protein
MNFVYVWHHRDEIVMEKSRRKARDRK